MPQLKSSFWEEKAGRSWRSKRTCSQQHQSRQLAPDHYTCLKTLSPAKIQTGLWRSFWHHFFGLLQLEQAIQVSFGALSTMKIRTNLQPRRLFWALIWRTKTNLSVFSGSLYTARSWNKQSVPHSRGSMRFSLSQGIAVIPEQEQMNDDLASWERVPHLFQNGDCHRAPSLQGAPGVLPESLTSSPTD